MIREDVRAIDAVCGALITDLQAKGYHVIVLSEYGLTDVTGPVHINRALRDAGVLAVRPELGLEALDPGASDAFYGGACTYLEAAKTTWADVPEGLLAQFGAVSAESAEAIWEVVREVAGELKASCVGLVVVEGNGTNRRSEFSWGFDQAPSSLLRARFSLLGERPDEGGIELGYGDGRRTVDRDTEIAVELLCEHLHAAVGRIGARQEAEQKRGRGRAKFGG